MRQAFSLVELSIVLVILGLLTGGIVAGQSLIRAAELRSVSTQLQNYMAASYAFRDKFNSLPGDIPTATRIWGPQNADPATCRTTPSTSILTCDGNGDNQIDSMDGDVTFSEIHRYWQHLANAGIIEGQYTGVGYTPAQPDRVVPGTNAPASKLGTAGFGIAWVGTSNGTANMFAGKYGNLFTFGTDYGAQPDGPTLRAEEMWSVDTKVDDGRPGYGFIRSYASGLRANCVGSTNPATAEYLYDNKNKGCTLLIISGL